MSRPKGSTNKSKLPTTSIQKTDENQGPIKEEPISTISINKTETSKQEHKAVDPTSTNLLAKYGNLASNPDFLNFLQFYPGAETLSSAEAIEIFKKKMYSR